MHFENANSQELPEIRQVLERCGIALGLSEALESEWKVARAGNCIVGVLGLHSHDTSAVLHSVAVVPGFRGMGIGRNLVHAAMDWSTQKHMETLYLYTNCAEFFFRSMGFKVLDHFETQVPLLHELGYSCDMGHRSMGHILFYNIAQVQAKEKEREYPYPYLFAQVG